jgi:transcriptional regulator with XRE-family HTH domain
VHTSSDSSVPPAPLLTGLGQALRWLRERQSRKQYRVADDAGITKGMLSAYETGRQRPSLETLDKLLETLGCDLNDLHNALQIVNGRPEQMKGWRDAIPAATAGPGMPPRPMLPLSGAASLAAGASASAATLPGAHRPAAWYPERRERMAANSANSANSADSASSASSAKSANGAYAYGAEGAESLGLPRAQRRSWQGPETYEVHEPAHLYDVLGLDPLQQAALAPEEEQAFGQMLAGFHSLLRYWHRSLAMLAVAAAVGGAAEPPTEPAGPGATAAAGPGGPARSAGSAGPAGSAGSAGSSGPAGPAASAGATGAPDAKETKSSKGSGRSGIRSGGAS